MFSFLPRRKEILDGMLHANLVCFQTYSYSRHSTLWCTRVSGYKATSGGGVHLQGHVSAIGYCRFGIHADCIV